VVAASDVIPLRAGLAALAFLGAGQLFEFAVKFFDLPTHVVRVLSDLRGQVVIQLIGDEPVNVAVWGDQLEQFDLERYFFQFDDDAGLEPFGRPLNRIEMHIAFFFTEADHAVAF